MAARISREFLDRMRDDPDFLEATPGDASEAVAIIDLAISALSHPAALERAHKEHEEACRYLERLVANVAPSPTKPLAGDLIGLCTQVDNLMCWVRERARAEGAVAIANGFILSRDLLRRVVPLLHWMIAHRAKVGPDNAVAAAAIATAIGALPSDPCAPDGALNTALEAARAEERERIDDLLTGLNVDPIKAAPEAHVGDFYAGVDAGINAALDAIRALGPSPRPSPEAEDVRCSTAKALAEVDGVTLQDIRSTVGPSEDANNWRRFLALVDDGWTPHTLRVLRAAEAPATPPALAPELRERVIELLVVMSDPDNWARWRAVRSAEAARALLSELSPQTDGGAK